MSTKKRDLGVRLKAGLPAASAATFFSVIVTIFIFFSGWQTFGSDFSQRLLLAINEDGGALGENPSANRDKVFNKNGPENWVLVDLGPLFCKEFAGKAPLCPTNPKDESQTTDRIALADTILWVARAKPRLIVVDMQSIRTIDQAGELDKKLESLKIPVLMAAPTTEKDGVILAADDAVQLVNRAEGKVRYYFPVIETEKPISRKLKPGFVIPGERDVSLPTLPCASALELWRVLDVTASDSDKPNTCSSEYTETERIFSFEALDPADPDKEPRTYFSARGENVKFRRLVAPQPNPQELAPDLGADAIVFIGDTRHDAEPPVQSAIGSVSGIEVVMNDTRQFALAFPSSKPNLFDVILGDIPFMIMGFVIVWLVTAVMWNASVPPASPTFGFWFNSLLDKLLQTLLVGFISTICFVFYILLNLGGSAPPDLITPLLGIVIGTFFELAGGGARWIDRQISKVLKLEHHEQ